MAKRFAASSPQDSRQTNGFGQEQVTGKAWPRRRLVAVAIPCGTDENGIVLTTPPQEITDVRSELALKAEACTNPKDSTRPHSDSLSAGTVEEANVLRAIICEILTKGIDVQVVEFEPDFRVHRVVSI